MMMMMMMIDRSWTVTIAWFLCILCIYSTIQAWLIPYAFEYDEKATRHLRRYVAPQAYQYSEAAFFTAAILNLISLFYEETKEKKQLALLSLLIKGLSWHCDYLISNNQTAIVYDAYDSLIIPSRYVQWSCTTPLMLFTLSKISDFTSLQVAVLVSYDFGMILTGFLAAMYPPGIVSFSLLAASFAFFYAVLWGIYRMLRSAMIDPNNLHACLGLNITILTSIVIWHFFPIGWCLSRMGMCFDWLGEPVQMIANFGAKIVFSSCILHNNYVTIQQHKTLVRISDEQRNRVKLVGDLQESLEHKDDFISAIGYELRTPINAIVQLSSALSNSECNREPVQNMNWIETITKSAQHLLGIINDIIMLKEARIGINMKEEMVDVAAITDYAIRTLSHLVKQDVEVKHVIPADLPLIVADERLLVQVIMNILSNAFKFTDKGRVSVYVNHNRLAQVIVITVTDTGCGMDPKMLSKHIHPFKQTGSGQGSRRHAGTGLGLSIAHTLIQAHRGKLRIKSALGNGTKVAITLPVSRIQSRVPFGSSTYFMEPVYTPNNSSTSDSITTMNKSRDRNKKNGTGTTGTSIEKYQNGQTTNFGNTSSDSKDRSKQDSKDSKESKESKRTIGASDCVGGIVDTAAGGTTTPPPLAVALISSLYNPPPPPSSCGTSDILMSQRTYSEVSHKPQQGAGAGTGAGAGAGAGAGTNANCIDNESRYYSVNDYHNALADKPTALRRTFNKIRRSIQNNKE